MPDPPKYDERDFAPGDLLTGIDDRDLIYFVLNVGNADAQVLVLPQVDGRRPVLIVDVGRAREKVRHLLEALSQPRTDGTRILDENSHIDLLVATHPHDDHIAGIPEFLDAFGEEQVVEYWDPGYWFQSDVYDETNRLLTELKIPRMHPTAGTQRFLGHALITVLGPTHSMKNRYDTYGVDPNNASITLLVEFPVAYGALDDRTNRRVGLQRRAFAGNTERLLLGGDAQTESWAETSTGFPALSSKFSPAFVNLKGAIETEPLRATVFKGQHHGSKHGLNLELVERIHPLYSLVSCAPTSRKHFFPHDVSMEALREGLERTAGRPNPARSDDLKLGIHTTGDLIKQDGTPLGSIAVILSGTTTKRELWRLGDKHDQRVTHADLVNARRCTVEPTHR